MKEKFQKIFFFFFSRESLFFRLFACLLKAFPTQLVTLLSLLVRQAIYGVKRKHVKTKQWSCYSHTPVVPG